MPILPIPVPETFRIIAHRGASAYAPENTLAAFRLAERMGAKEVELDVQLTSDRKLIIIHDEKLNRYGYPDLTVKGLSLAEITALDMGAWFSPYFFRHENALSLETLLATFHDRFFYHIEIKQSSAELPPILLDCLKQYGLAHQTIITSFHYEMLQQVRALAPQQPTGWLLKAGTFTPENVEKSAVTGFFQVCPHAADVTVENVRAAHAQVREVRAFGIANLADALRVIETGCDGLTINWPDWLVHAPNVPARLP